MKIVGIIPARMASSRFPGKPLARICGIPMVGHVYMRARMCKALDDVYIATCDNEISKYAVSIGAWPVMTAPTHERASDRTAEAMARIEERSSGKADITVMIQGDEPLVYPEMIEDAIAPLLKDDTLQVTNLMADLKSQAEFEDANVVKVVTDEHDFALYFSREPIPSRKKWKKGIPMRKQIAIIPFRRDFLITFNSLNPTPLETIESVDMLRLLEHGYRIKMVLTKFDICGVDTPEDLKRAEKMMSRDKLFFEYGKAALR